MEIRCPICGKKYSYDRKICQECEDYSIYSGVYDVDGKKYHKWNCSVFLKISSSAFKTSKIRELTKELSPEPNNLVIHEREIYDWNCEPNHHIYRKKETTYTPLTLGVFSTIMKNKTDSHLFFE
jgi:hypothetical protein